MALLEEAGLAAVLFQTWWGRGQNSRKNKLQRIKVVTTWAKYKQPARLVSWLLTHWPGSVVVTKPISVPMWQQLMQQVQCVFV